MLRLAGIVLGALGTVFLVLAVYVLVVAGVSVAFLGLLLSAAAGILLGWNLILQSKGLMD